MMFQILLFNFCVAHVFKFAYHVHADLELDLGLGLGFFGEGLGSRSRSRGKLSLTSLRRGYAHDGWRLNRFRPGLQRV